MELGILVMLGLVVIMTLFSDLEGSDGFYSRVIFIVIAFVVVCLFLKHL